MARTKTSTELSAKWTPQFFANVDQRSMLYREIKTRLDELRQDVGVDSMQKELMCQQVVFISLQLETAQVRAIEEGIFDQGIYTQMVNCLSGLLTKLGLERAAPKALDLQDYVKDYDKKVRA